MNRTKLKNYAPQARRDFIQAVTDRAAFYGLTAKKIEPVAEKGDVAVIGGRSIPRAVAEKRKQLEERDQAARLRADDGGLAYTWFNRLVAIRFMELHGYLDHGYRVLSHPEGQADAGNPGTRRACRTAGPEQENGHRPEARRHQGGRTLPAAAHRPVQRPARGHAVPVRED